MPEMKGGCLCGKVRYSANADPIFVGVCHCRDCQRWSGSAFTAEIGLPSPTLQVEGTLTTFTSTADSGKKIFRRFCPSCGSSVVTEVEAMPGLSMVGSGTLDDNSWVKPGMQIFCDSSQAWVHLSGEMTSFPRMPG